MEIDMNIYFPSLIAMLFLFCFMLVDNSLEKKIKNKFYLLMFFALIELIAYLMEFVYTAKPTFSPGIVFYTALGYTVRPILLYMIISVALRDSKHYKLYAGVQIILISINTVLAFSAFWVDIMYSFTPDNQFVRGPLGYISHVTAVIQEIFILLHTLRTYKKRGLFESLLITAMLGVITVSMYLETNHQGIGIGRSAISISIVFYYMFFQTQNFLESIKAGEHKRRSLEYENSRDDLTSLLNKKYFSKRSTEIMADESTTSAVCIFLDIDNFKEINDSFGHPYGDEVLKQVASILKGTFRKEDLISRFGGDEFCILLANVPLRNIPKQLENLVKSLQLVFEQGHEVVEISTSIGAIYCNNKEKLDYYSLLQEADKALYESKQGGKNQFKLKIIQ